MLSLTIEFGNYKETLAKRLAAELAEFERTATTFEAKRDLAVVLSSAGRPDDARRRAGEAAALAAKDPLREGEIGLLRALIALRANVMPAASKFVQDACRPAVPTEIAAACAHLSALTAGLIGDKQRAAGRLREIHRSAVPVAFEQEFLPREARWDGLRAAYFDTMRAIYGAVWSRLDRDDLERRVAYSSLSKLVNTMGSEGATAQASWDAMRTLVHVELVHNNLALARHFITLFGQQVIDRYSGGPEDLGWLQLSFSRVYAGVLNRSGDRAAADAAIAKATGLIERTGEGIERYARLFYLASELDVPEAPAPAVRIFEEVWRWAARASAAAAGKPTQRDFDEQIRDIPPPPVSHGHSWEFNVDPEPERDETPLALQFVTGLRLLTLYAAAQDLRRMEQYRVETTTVAGQLDEEIGGPPMHVALLRIATADAIRRFSPTPERLRQAEKILLEVRTDLNTRFKFPSGEPSLVYRAWERIGRKLEGGTSTYITTMLVRERLQARLDPALGRVYQLQGRLKEAQHTLQQGYEFFITENSVGGRPLEQSAMALDLALITAALRDLKSLESWSSEALLGLSIVDPTSLHLAAAMAARSKLLAARGDWYGAELALSRAIAIQHDLGTAGRRKLAEYSLALASLYLELGDTDRSLETARPATQALVDVGSRQWTSTERAAIESHIEAVARKLETVPEEDRPALREEAFALTQRWMANQAGQALEQAARRAALDDPHLEAVVQQRSEAMRELDVLDVQFREAFASAGARDNTAARDRINAEISRLDAELRGLNQSLGDRLLDLSDPRPVSIESVRRVLGDGETLIVITPTAQATYAWLVARKGDARWVRLRVDAMTLASRITALRCGLDETGWSSERGAPCKRLTGKTWDPRGQAMLPFDVGAAHRLYLDLFGPFGSEIAGKHLLVAAAGAVTSLPLGVLVAEAPSGEQSSASLANASWLGARNAISILPLPVSLMTLRAGPPRPTAARPYVAFASPLLLGKHATAEQRSLTKAWGMCSKVDPKQCSSLVSTRTSGSPARPNVLREDWDPLPQTACEVCSIARQLGIGAAEADAEIRLARRATEAEVKTLGYARAGVGTSELQAYRIVHFATHGAVAGNVAGPGEPGLVLTPPEGSGSEYDDGYLSASEIARLRLNADWVILSACNTAAGDGTSAEALSGLARAFLFAGARSVLVSHWNVYTDAGVKLTTSAVRELARGAAGRAEALRAAIAGHLGEPRSVGLAWQAHPSFWGAFSLIGEGGAGR
jgi:CHAT domain-containing protein